MSKRYGSNQALHDVSFSIQGGRVHALMGENGAGKSTLIKLLAGVIQADAFDLAIDGVSHSLKNAADAHKLGFRFIHQELNIVPQISVAENILLNRQLPTRFGFAVDWKSVHNLAFEALEILGAEKINLEARAGDLSPDNQMLIKIAAALVAEPGQDSSLYVLDEPTAALNEEESEKLFAVIKKLTERGAAILYVSHRMDEVMRICDDITVLRDGKHVMTCTVSHTSKSEIIMAMTGKDLADTYPPRTGKMTSETVAKVQGDTTRLRGLDFDIRAGEILGVSGLSQSGQTDLIRLFLGYDGMIRGQARFIGGALPKSPTAAWANGVAHIPRERRAEGLMIDMTIRSNIVLPHLKGFFANTQQELESTKRLAKSVALKFEGPNQPIRQLSGGNQQKALFARALMTAPKLLLLEEPTRGVDVGAKWEIYSIIRALSAAGCAIILTSSDHPETLGLCDRVLVLVDHEQKHCLNADLAPSELVAHFYTQSEAVQ